MSSPKPPQDNSARDYRKGIETNLKYLPKLLLAEQNARQQYDPQRIDEQMALQDQYGARQSQQQLDALHRLDPQGAAIRQQVGQQVQSDLASGYNLPPGLQRAVTSQIRGAEAARGNDLGNAAITAESVYSGNAMQQLYQQHLQNAEQFLSGPTPEQQLLAVSPVSPDRSSAYVNPSAGYAGQAVGAQNYQNLLAQWQAAGGGQTPGWVGMSGQIVGGVLGAYYGGGPQGAQLGAAAGGAAANGTYSLFSDERLKHSIVKVGESLKGYPIYEFSYRDCPGRFRGTIAQKILPLKPEAVSMDGLGFWKVDYGKLDVPFEEIPELVEA